MSISTFNARMLASGDQVNAGGFNAMIGLRRAAEELHIGTHEMEWNEQDEKNGERCEVQETKLRDISSWNHFASLSSLWEDSVSDIIAEEHGRLVEHLHSSATKAEGLEDVEKRLSSEILELISQRGIARAAGSNQLTSELAKL
ncbi:unnamed protein product [Haemonchus placei]|uniref:Uncharacterized protein n=1 Tax=Haemonchus placei TaxID=6290 RepID=A0A0N4W2M7_HAEPC|nr:unnamed protein product [Haemonchus placei]